MRSHIAGLPHLMNILVSFLQILIGGILVASGVGKVLDPSGFADVLKHYQAFPESALFSIALIVTVFECLLGGWILSGWRLLTSAITAASMNMV